MSLVAHQREELVWAAGRKNKDRGGFGYDPANAEIQAGNVSEYLLRNTATGRLEYVTPLTLANSSSELLVAYGISPADQVNAGSLNPYKVYVLAENDPRRVNLDTLTSKITTFLQNYAQGFVSSKGRIVELTPVNGITWRAFGENQNIVVLRLDVDSRSGTTPTLVQLDQSLQLNGGNTGTGNSGTSSGPTTATPGSNCGSPVDKLTSKQLAQCLHQFANALAQRQVPSK
jgi:hypothetical protein